ncbi:MAG: signal peptidase II, partial [Thiohalobacterales bacterium]
MKWFWLSGVVLILDQCSKLIADALLQFNQPVPLLPFLDLRKVYNPGAAFSFLSDASGWQRWFFVGLTLFVSLVLAVWLRRLQAGQARLALALSLILGGALGNLIDRVVYGYVIDFIDLYYGDWHWPVFNVADSAITVGASLLILDA